MKQVEGLHRTWITYMDECDDIRKETLVICPHISIPTAIEEYEGHEYVESIIVHCVICNEDFEIMTKCN